MKENERLSGQLAEVEVQAQTEGASPREHRAERTPQSASPAAPPQESADLSSLQQIQQRLSQLLPSQLQSLTAQADELLPSRDAQAGQAREAREAREAAPAIQMAPAYCPPNPLLILRPTQSTINQIHQEIRATLPDLDYLDHHLGEFRSFNDASEDTEQRSLAQEAAGVPARTAESVALQYSVEGPQPPPEECLTAELIPPSPALLCGEQAEDGPPQTLDKPEEAIQQAGKREPDSQLDGESAASQPEPYQEMTLSLTQGPSLQHDFKEAKPVQLSEQRRSEILEQSRILLLNARPAPRQREEEQQEPQEQEELSQSTNLHVSAAKLPDQSASKQKIVKSLTEIEEDELDNLLDLLNSRSMKK